MLEAENRRRLARQSDMYAHDRPLWQRYEQACDFLEDDLESGYVRVLQEMIAEGWSTPAIAEAVASCCRLVRAAHRGAAEAEAERSAASGRSTGREWRR